MEIIEDAISLKLSEAFKKCFDVDVAPDAVKFQKTHSGFKGDITFVVFPFLSLTKNSPDNTAKKLGEYYQKLGFTKINNSAYLVLGTAKIYRFFSQLIELFS